MLMFGNFELNVSRKVKIKLLYRFAKFLYS